MSEPQDQTADKQTAGNSVNTASSVFSAVFEILRSPDFRQTLNDFGRSIGQNIAPSGNLSATEEPYNYAMSSTGETKKGAYTGSITGPPLPQSVTMPQLLPKLQIANDRLEVQSNRILNVLCQLSPELRERAEKNASQVPPSHQDFGYETLTHHTLRFEGNVQRLDLILDVLTNATF